MSKKNIFEILNKELDLKDEVDKLQKLFGEKKLIKIQKYSTSRSIDISYKTLCDKYLALWEYRNTWISLFDIEREIGIYLSRNKNIESTCILYCELILNMRKLIIDKIKEKYYKIMLDDDILTKNIDYLIENLNYKQICDSNKIVLTKKNVDSELAAAAIPDNDVSIDILKYNDIRINKNISEKSKILFNIYKYYEGMEKEIKQGNSKLCNLIDRLYNTSNIRHNNQFGYNENEKFNTLQTEEIIDLYDKLYFLIIYAIRTPEIKNIEKDLNNYILN